jgi:hypothetical protein
MVLKTPGRSLGLVVFAPAAGMFCRSADDCGTDDTAMLAGLGAILVGAVLAPVGWSMVRHNRVRLEAR